MNALFNAAATTNDVTIRVAATFLPEQSQPERGRWFWAYHIRIENHRDGPVQLLTRHWKITDGNGYVSVVEGEGVVGEQPILAPGASHDYVSGCPLATPNGEMVGHYGMVCDGRPILVDIPRFALRVPADAR